MSHKPLAKRFFSWLIGLGVVALGGLFGYRYVTNHDDASIELETSAVDRGDIVQRVAATGTLSPVVTVEVGSQVSGRIDELFADFNAAVEEGEVLAQLDTQSFEAALEQASANYSAARAGVTVAEAQATDAERQAERARRLAERDLVAQEEADTAESAAIVARARVESAQAEVRRARAARDAARVNLELTTIYSPISGTVISRDVDVGQTVAASLSAPVLFVIAEDLRRMQVDTSVAEADVGMLRDGMPATFTVDAFPDERFEGVVRQIRNAPETVQNVVTYDAVVDVVNDALKLRPGMTANVTFVVQERHDVLRLPNAALRFRAPESFVCEPVGEGSGAPGRDGDAEGGPGGGRGRGEGASDRPGPPEGWAGGGPPAGGFASASGVSPAGGGEGHRAANCRTVWVAREGSPTCVQVRLGLSDGSFTEVLGGDLREGDEVITDAVDPSADAEPSERPRGRGRGPRMF